jgi:hypothetical protein
MGVPKFPKLGLLRLCGAITLCAYLLFGWGLKKSCSLHQELSNRMLHATCTQGNRGDSRFLMVGNQIVNLTPNPSFGHNLCFRCLNGSCKPTLYIQVPRVFQWYEELPNPMGFGPFNCSLKIWVSQPHFGQVWGWNSHSQSWGLGVLRDSRMFRARQQGAKHLALGCA